MNRAAFFTSIRASLYGGRLTPTQVRGAEAILTEWETRKGADLRCLAYILATAYHEAGRNLQPVREIGRGRGQKYGKAVNGHVYYGRGLVQLTWDYNYRKAGARLGVDLLGNPDLALDPGIAARILIVGMAEGWFTGKKLADYFTVKNSDWLNARRIVNGTDRAALIAGYAKKFHIALEAARDVPAVLAEAAEAAKPADTFSAPVTSIAAMREAMQPERTSEMATVTVPVKSAWYSRISWTQIGFTAASYAAAWFLGLPPSEQVAVTLGSQTLQSVVTVVLRTWFSPSAVASQLG